MSKHINKKLKLDNNSNNSNNSNNNNLNSTGVQTLEQQQTQQQQQQLFICSDKSNIYFTLWRTKYIRYKIRNFTLENKKISIDLHYLNENHHFLSTLDTNNNNIFIELRVNDEKSYFKYLESPYIYLINSLYLSTEPSLIEEIRNNKPLPNYLKQLSIKINTYSTKSLQLDVIPETVSELYLAPKGVHFFNMPAHIKNLTLEEYEFESRYHDDLIQSSSLDYLKIAKPLLQQGEAAFNIENIIIAFPYIRKNGLQTIGRNPRRIFKENQKSLVKMTLQLFVTGLVFGNSGFNTFVTKLCLPEFNSELLQGNLPLSLESLNAEKLNHVLKKEVLPNTLAKMNLYRYNQRLDSQVLPNSLNYINLHSFNQELNPGVLGNNVSKLYLSSFNQPLGQNVLPNSLTELNLASFNQPLEAGILPTFLRGLDMAKFNKPIGVGVLPSSLQQLYLFKYNQRLPELSLPNSLEMLYIPNFIPQCPMDQLPYYGNIKELSIGSLAKGVTTDFLPLSVIDLSIHCSKFEIERDVITKNVIRLSVYFKTIGKADLPPNISSLLLHKTGNNRVKFQPTSIISNHIKDLSLYNIPISQGLIPSSCYSFKTNRVQFKEGDLPSTIKYIKIDNHIEDVNQFLIDNNGFLPKNITLKIVGDNTLYSIHEKDLQVKEIVSVEEQEQEQEQEEAVINPSITTITTPIVIQ
ncbi:hypothetical protein CYY_001308 [Polysphondylium violaceum]|uniref:FNIP repeat-containing protein n=1 Tax=Polysphondylium violaceum TaxID=133409 RepID=A0A8J4Q285_9MYCE|nr:hypothetical protein CYY_001308 [Polysphondylium violaceum]